MFVHLNSGIILFAKRSILNVWQSPEYVCVSNCSVYCTVTVWYVMHQAQNNSTLCFSAICGHIQSYWALLRHIHTYRDIPAFSVIFSTLCKPHIFATLPLFRALACSEFKTNLKAYSRGLFKTERWPKIFRRHYSAIFRHFQNLEQPLHMQKPDILRILEYSEPYNCILAYVQSPVVFTKIYEYSEL